MIISKNKCIKFHKTNIKILPNFHKITMYLRKSRILKIMSRGKFLFWQLVMNFAYFRWNNIIRVSANKVIIIKKTSDFKNSHQESSYFDGLWPILTIFDEIIEFYGIKRGKKHIYKILALRKVFISTTSAEK